MNKLKLVAVIALFCANGILAQIKYEPGYYFDTAGNKISGMIRNVAWKDNPKSIEFKTEENAPSASIALSQMKGFEVGGYEYRKFDLKYDTSSRDVGTLSALPGAQWANETAMLKVIALGALNLYEYSDHNIALFFISDASTKTPEQLVFKEYRTEDGRIAENRYYRQQLYNATLSKDFPKSEFERLDYERDDLLKIIAKYNGNEQKDMTQKQNKSKLHLYVKAGASSAKLDYNQIFYNSSGDFGNQIVPMAGIEAEFVLPFNQNKWSIFAGANYQSYKGDRSEMGTKAFTGEYSFVEIPMGIRHSFFIGTNSRLFLNVGLAIAVPTSSELTYTNTAPGTFGSNVEAERASSVFGGVGFAYSRFSAELRFNAKRQVVTDAYWRSDYSSTGLALGYRIF